MHFKIAKFCGIIVGIESCLVITGWILGINQFTRILPYGINMKFPTALAFFFSASCIFFLSESIKTKDSTIKQMLLLNGLVIFLMMFLLLIVNLLDIQTSLEELFVKQQDFWYGFGAGAPSLSTIINFMLFGVVSMSSFFFDSWFYFRLKFFGYIILAIGLIPVFGYAFNIPMLYYQFNATTIPMALNTALTFVLLSSGLIFIGYSKNNLQSNE
jgi:hypothetical protein